MIFGFTGTRRGMTDAQQRSFSTLCIELGVKHLHHGCCMGADVQANKFARILDIRTEGWPSTSKSTRRVCELDAIHIEYPPLVRDRFIVEYGINGLIATPFSKEELRRSGTWTTIRHARRKNRNIWIILPDGTVKPEPAKVLAL